MANTSHVPSAMAWERFNMPYIIFDQNEAARSHAAAVLHSFWPKFQEVLALVSKRDGILGDCLEAVWSKQSFTNSGRYSGIWLQTFREEYVIGHANVPDLKYFVDELTDMLTTAKLMECREEETPQYFEPLFLARALNYFRGTRKQMSNMTWKYVITTMLDLKAVTTFGVPEDGILRDVEHECPETLKVALADWLFNNKRAITPQHRDLLLTIKEPTCHGMITHVLKEFAS